MPRSRCPRVFCPLLAVLLILPSCGVVATGDEAPPGKPALKPAEALPPTPEAKAAQALLDRYKTETKVQQEQRRHLAAQHFQVGKAHFDMGDWQRATTHFGKALDLDPTHKEAPDYLRKARSLLGIREGRGELFQRYLGERSVAIDALRTELATLFAEAKALYARGQYAEAIEAFTRVRAKADYLAPRLDSGKIAEDAAAYLRKAQEALEQQRGAAEKERLRRAREEADRVREQRQGLLDERRESRLRQAEALFEQGRHEAARELCDRVLTDDPASGPALALRERAVEARRHALVAQALRHREAEMRHLWEQLRIWTAPQTELVDMPRDRFEAVRTRRERAIFSSEERAEEPWEAQVRESLDRKVSFDFVETPLQDVVSFLTSIAGVSMVLDTEAIKGEAPEITLRVNDMRLGAALNWICKLTGLRFALKHEAVFISKAGRIYDTPVLRMYDVTDLTVEIKNFKGRQRALATSSGYGPEAEGIDAAEFFDEEEEQDKPLTGEALIEFIKRIIAPNSWKDEEEFGRIGDPLGFRGDAREGKGQELVDLIGVTVGGRTFLAVRTLE